MSSWVPWPHFIDTKNDFSGPNSLKLAAQVLIFLP